MIIQQYQKELSILHSGVDGIVMLEKVDHNEVN